MNEYFFANCLDNSYNKNVNYILFKEMILLDIYQESLKYHENLKGKYEIKSRATINNAQDLSLAYTPGVADKTGHIQMESKDVVINLGSDSVNAIYMGNMKLY